MVSVEVVGVYPVDAPEPVHLVELLLKDLHGAVDMAEFVQRSETQPPENWQTAYDERILSTDGADVVWRPWTDPVPEDAWTGDVRLTFFMHYLDDDTPLTTPIGEVALPPPSPLPARLVPVDYEAP